MQFPGLLSWLYEFFLPLLQQGRHLCHGIKHFSFSSVRAQLNLKMDFSIVIHPSLIPYFHQVGETSHNCLILLCQSTIRFKDGFFNCQFTKFYLPYFHQVVETGCSMTSPVLLASEDSLTKDECQSFCTGKQAMMLMLGIAKNTVRGMEMKR